MIKTTRHVISSADCWWLSLEKKEYAASPFAESSAMRVIITQFALDEVISLVPSHPPPYVMFSSLQTWCIHRRSGILSAVSSVLLCSTRAMFFPLPHSMNSLYIGAACWCRDPSINSRNLDIFNEISFLAKVQDKESTPHSAQIRLSYRFICAITNYVIPWSYSSRPMSCLATQS